MSEIEKSTDRIQNVRIEDEMRGAYLDYAMSVIVGRALPDVRDGLKPVHRRALFAMYDLSNTYDKPYKKSARVVGDVIGKYHPHGDSAVYETIVRMAQSFSLRYPLTDGQGNFGSIDGDAPAAMRYTEIRMAKIADGLLEDLEKETVDFIPNYDDSLKEPRVLPCKFPNLLINGTSGIAVGMATNIPPHNLSEVVDGCVALLKNPDATIEDLLEHVKGPDFPTAGAIVSGEIIRNIYKTGRGVLLVRGKAEIELGKGDREKIVISELPYLVNKARLIEKVADLVKDKRIEGISDIRDESDRRGIRVVIDIKKGENSTIILNRLYSLTQLQESFGVSLLAIHQNRPKVFNLKEMLQAFLDHRKEVVTRRTAFELKKAEHRAHILAGLKKAVENLDTVIQIIKGAQNPEDARRQLIDRFEFSELQAKEILDMRLHRLTGLERDKIINEFHETMKLIERLKQILSSDQLIRGIIEAELLEIKKNYGDARRTRIEFGQTQGFEEEDLIDDDEALVAITHKGYIKRFDPSLFKSQNRGGRGIKGLTVEEDDFVTQVYHTSNLSTLLFLSSLGKIYSLKVYKIPEASRTAKGRAIVNLLPLQANEKISAILDVKEFRESEYLVAVTKQGTIKKTAMSEYRNIRANGITGILVDKEDSVINAKITDGTHDIFICTKEGLSIRFNESDARPMGRSAHGVRGVTLEQGDEVVATDTVSAAAAKTTEILTISENGFGKRTPFEEYRLQSRGGKGIITMRASDRNGSVVTAVQVSGQDEIMMVTNKGQMIRLRVGDISEQGRATQGVKLMNLQEGEKVVGVDRVSEAQEKKQDPTAAT